MMLRKMCLPLLCACTTWADEASPLSFSGLVNFDNIFDSRQVVTQREGHLLLWPERQSCDPNGEDINDKGQLSMIPLYARATVAYDGPHLAHDMENRALIEADFRGTSTENSSLLRLRLAYAEFMWEHTSLRIGKGWHPIFVQECAPRMVSYENGEPINPQVRTPHIRVAHTIPAAKHNISHTWILSAGSQSVGSRLLGFAGSGYTRDNHLELRSSSDFLRRAVVPNIHLQYQQERDGHLFGVGSEYQRIYPRLETAEGFSERSPLDSGSFIAFAALHFPRWSLRQEVLFTENVTAYNLPHGFAVATRDPVTDRQTYTNMRALGYWLDMDLMTDSDLQPGIFVGAHTSLGTSNRLVRDASNHVTLIANEPDLDRLIKVAPRVWWSQDPIEVGAEIGIAHAQFAQPERPDAGEAKFDDFGNALQTQGVTNVRCIAGLYYYF